MEAPQSTAEAPTPSKPKWEPLERVDRRVVGVLMEKAKTTPDNYPLSRNALVNGCNQKSNRYPQMELDEEQVDESLDRLKKLGAASQIQSDGRVDKFRHLMYDWLGVDKVELAVMAELLLRGAQTLGDLRARASRMESIAGISELRPIVNSLQEKGLLIYLTPPGRGCIVTHALYQPRELDKLRTEHGGFSGSGQGESFSDIDENRPARAAATTSGTVVESEGSVAALRAEIAALKQQLAALEQRVDRLAD